MKEIKESVGNFYYTLANSSDPFPLRKLITRQEKYAEKINGHLASLPPSAFMAAFICLLLAKAPSSGVYSLNTKNSKNYTSNNFWIKLEVIWLFEKLFLFSWPLFHFLPSFCQAT